MNETKYVQPPTLEFRNGLWCGENEEFIVKMDDTTMQGYITGYLEAHGITRPVPQQTRAAFQAVTLVSYWRGDNKDEAVRITRKQQP